MRLTEGHPAARVLAFGGYQPARVVTNDELARTVETSDEWIRSRVGIASRRIAGPDETVADMAVQAGGKALAGSGLSPADIDLVIVATCTPEVQIPNVAASVAKRLGILAPGAYDLNAACAGFCYALANAADAVRTGTDLGHVEMRGGTHVVAPDFAATVIEWLVEDGDPVSAGQPLVRLQPQLAD